MHGQQNDKYTEMRGQQNVKIITALSLFVTKPTVRAIKQQQAEFYRNRTTAD